MKTTAKLAGLAATAGLALGTVGLAGPAAAAPEGDTATTFEIEGGTLDVTVPTNADLGAVAAGVGTISGSLGAVSVSDTRAALDASWATSVSATDFTTGGGTPAETIAAASVSYAPGTATATAGNGTFGAGAGGTLDTPAAAFGHTGGSGVNSASWSPTVTITPAASNVAGVYAGTITHSVA